MIGLKQKNDRFFYVSTADLLSGHITKNSLCHCSSGERAVIDFLNCHKINYIFQYRDKRCINPKTKKIPEPHAGSQMLSPFCGSSNSAIKSDTSGGV